MRILVTGGAGFIGKHLCRRLVGEGHDVCALDLRKPEVHEWFTDDVTWNCECAWTNFYYERIYHLACHASPKRYQENPVHTLDTCFSGTMNVLEHANPHFVRPRPCKVLLASTSEIYGEPEVHPQPESYRGNVATMGPRSMYDEGKRVAESLMWAYQQLGVDTRIARIFNTYGPGMDFDDGRVISNFVTQALKGEPLTIYGDGSQTRSFCYIDDMVEGLIRLMEYEGPECHEPHNLGNPHEISVMDLAVGLVRENRLFNDPVTGGGRSTHYNLPQDDPTRRCPDITRAKKNLGWEPKVGLSEGLRRTVEDFRSRMKLEAAT